MVSSHKEASSDWLSEKKRRLTEYGYDALGNRVSMTDANGYLTPYVYDSAGPFVYLNTLYWGDKVIVHASGQRYIYEVRAVKEVAPTDVEAMMKHEELPWLTLVSCKGYDEDSGEYRSRVLVRAVLVEVKYE